jgi:hypothetical protein
MFISHKPTWYRDTVKLYMEGINVFLKILYVFFHNDFDLIFGVLTPLSAIFQIYHGKQF